MQQTRKILDACCGGRMFWFNKAHPDVLFMDNRQFDGELCDGRHFTVSPDMVGDFRAMPFENDTFYLVVFDPPHLMRAGDTSWLAQKYGQLNPGTYKDDLRKGFQECFRVLKPNGVLVFKWNESDIKTRDIICLAPYPPLFGHRSGKFSKTQWLVFMKPDAGKDSG